MTEELGFNDKSGSLVCQNLSGVDGGGVGIFDEAD